MPVQAIAVSCFLSYFVLLRCSGISGLYLLLRGYFFIMMCVVVFRPGIMWGSQNGTLHLFKLCFCVSCFAVCFMSALSLITFFFLDLFTLLFSRRADHLQQVVNLLSYIIPFDMWPPLFFNLLIICIFFLICFSVCFCGVAFLQYSLTIMALKLFFETD